VGAEPCLMRYALASVGQWSSFINCEIFRGQRPLAPEIWASEKVDFEWVEKRSHFALCGPKFTKFGRHVPNLYQSGDICNKIAKWRVENYVFRPKKFWEKDPQNQMRTFYASFGTYQVGKFGAIPPNRSRRYKPKYTRFLANFRISGVKKLLGQTHP